MSEAAVPGIWDCDADMVTSLPALADSTAAVAAPLTAVRSMDVRCDCGFLLEGTSLGCRELLGMPGTTSLQRAVSESTPKPCCPTVAAAALTAFKQQRKTWRTPLNVLAVEASLWRKESRLRRTLAASVSLLLLKALTLPGIGSAVCESFVAVRAACTAADAPADAPAAAPRVRAFVLPTGCTFAVAPARCTQRVLHHVRHAEPENAATWVAPCSTAAM